MMIASMVRAATQVVLRKRVQRKPRDHQQIIDSYFAAVLVAFDFPSSPVAALKAVASFSAGPVPQ